MQATIDGAIGTVTPPTDPKAATPPANIIETGKGVTVDPTKTAENKEGEGQRPAWLPEKFKTPEEMAAAYKELETKQSQTPKPDAAAAAADAVQKAGLDVAAISKEFTENGGKLTDATMKTLADKGITAEMVNGYVTGLQAQASQQRSELESVAGGAERLASVYQWATTNMSPAEIKAYNDLVNGGNMAGAKTMLQGIVSRFTAATGSDPKLVTGAPAAAATAAPFESTAQVVEAIRDPKYATDPAYRAKVEARLAVSKVFGL